MKYRYIAIEREYGSAGTEIARKLASECGISCFGREILEEVSKKYDISVDRIEQYEEKVTGSFLYSVFMLTKAQSGDANIVTNEGYTYLAEQEVIKNKAAEGPAIFLGHCATEALKDNKDVIKVFIRSGMAEKKKRVVSEYYIPLGKVEETMKRFDKKRSNYYYANTGKHWDDMKNYDIVLDSGTLGVDGCVSVLKALVNEE